ncbi:hypothetical protein QC762_211070 [Podospora pseudocomata]|uniref:Uncharacterized protein n=1 Tax=Podospora pseudocomata TaxID=2093779 RepID=A0ABR0GNA9_9PEZI|nr:hypothetical protein QC762_211070 [Podospora pseudocomata]
MSFLQWMRQALQQLNQQPCDQQDDEYCNEEYYVEGGYDEELEREAGNVGYGYRDFISSDDDDSVMAKPARRATRAQTRAQAAAAAAASAAQNTGTAGQQQQQQQQTATVSDEESEAVYESLSSSPSHSGSEEEVDQSPAQPVVVSSPNTDVSPDNSGGGRGKTPSAASGGRKTPTPSVVGSVTGPKTPPPQPPPPPGRKTPEPPKTPPGRTPGGNTPRQSTPGRGGAGGLVTPVTLGGARKKNVVSVAGSNLGPGGDVAAAALPGVGVGGGVNAFTPTGGVVAAAAAAAAAGGRSTGAAPTAESDLYWTGYVAHSARRAATEPDGLDPPADVMEMDTSDESDASFDGGGDGGGGPGGDDGARKKVWAEEGMRKAVRESELPAVRYDKNGNVIPDLEREKNRRRLGLGEVFNDNKGFYKAVKELMQMGVFGQKETEAVVRAWREGLGLGTVGKDRKEREQWKKEWEGMKNVKWDNLNGKEYGSMKKKEWKLKGQRKGMSKLFRDKVVFGEFGTQVETAHTWWGRYGKVPTRLVREFRGTGAGCRLQGLTWEGRLTKTDFEIFLRKWLEWRYGRFMEDRGASRRKRRAQERVERREKKMLREDWQFAFLSF